MKFFIFSYSYMARCLVTLVPLGLALLLPLLGQSKAFSQEAILVPTSTPITAMELNYQSVFGQYQGFQDQAVSSWFQNNATVATIGGWRVYAKEALLPSSEPAVAHQPSHLHHGSKP